MKHKLTTYGMGHGVVAACHDDGSFCCYKTVVCLDADNKQTTPDKALTVCTLGNRPCWADEVAAVAYGLGIIEARLYAISHDIPAEPLFREESVLFDVDLKEVRHAA